ncbi:MAG: hypothetical protein FOGNACKC_00812 [Anaerolineae bacterium]|nr:hypothetical protein [Anaerolineae bacterium]
MSTQQRRDNARFRRAAEGQMNIYELLTSRGWKKVGGTSRVTYFKKNGWMAIVPWSVAFPVRYMRVRWS